MNNLDENELMKKKFKEIALKVDDFILKNLSKKASNLWKSSQHYIVAGGKRLRPFFVLKSYSLLAENYEIIIPAAAAIEIFYPTQF